MCGGFLVQVTLISLAMVTGVLRIVQKDQCNFLALAVWDQPYLTITLLQRLLPVSDQNNIYKLNWIYFHIFLCTKILDLPNYCSYI